MDAADMTEVTEEMLEVALLEFPLMLRGDAFRRTLRSAIEAAERIRPRPSIRCAECERLEEKRKERFGR